MRIWNRHNYVSKLLSMRAIWWIDTVSAESNQFQNVSVKHRQLCAKMMGVQSSRLSDGTIVDTNSEGLMVQVVYASGAKVKRNSEYCMVQTAGGDYWIGDSRGSWFSLD